MNNLDHEFIRLHHRKKSLKLKGEFTIFEFKMDPTVDYIKIFRLLKTPIFMSMKPGSMICYAITTTIFQFVFIYTNISKVYNSTNDPVSFCLVEMFINNYNKRLFLTKTGILLNKDVNMYSYFKLFESII